MAAFTVVGRGRGEWIEGALRFFGLGWGFAAFLGFLLEFFGECGVQAGGVFGVVEEVFGIFDGFEDVLDNFAGDLGDIYITKLKIQSPIESAHDEGTLFLVDGVGVGLLGLGVNDGLGLGRSDAGGDAGHLHDGGGAAACDFGFFGGIGEFDGPGEGVGRVLEGEKFELVGGELELEFEMVAHGGIGERLHEVLFGAIEVFEELMEMDEAVGEGFEQFFGRYGERLDEIIILEFEVGREHGEAPFWGIQNSEF